MQSAIFPSKMTEKSDEKLFFGENRLKFTLDAEMIRAGFGTTLKYSNCFWDN